MEAVRRDGLGRPLCRWCKTAVSGRRRTFCSDACVHEWRLRSSASYLRECVYERDKGICALCGKKKKWEADHVVPVVEGGDSNLENIRTLCIKCHRRETAELRQRRYTRRNGTLEGGGGASRGADARGHGDDAG